MASRLRSGVSPKISFFSFQDIITSVTGILILVTLMLTLHVTQGAGDDDARPNPAGEVRLRALEAELRTVNASNLVLQRLVILAEEVSNPEALAREVAGLRGDLAERESTAVALRTRLEDRERQTRERASALGLAAEAARNEVVQQTLERLRLTNEMLSAEVRALQDFTNRVRPRLGGQTLENLKVWLIPEAESSPKQPVIVEVSGHGLVTQRLRRPDTRQEVAETGAVEHLAVLLNRLSPAKDYLLFYLRPSGIELFERCRAAARTAGFEVGYDALEEDQILVLQPPSSP